MIINNKKTLVTIAIIVLIMPLLAGCIGGGDDDSKSPYEGDIEDLLLTNDEIPEKYAEMAERVSMPASEIFPDDDLPDDLGFDEAYALTAMYFDEDFNFGIIAQLVMRLDIEEMEKAMDEYKDAQMEEYEDEWESVDFGDIGDETFGIMFTDEDLGTEAYELVFTKDDIMVVLIVAGEENAKSLIEDLAETVEDKL
jgi:hypothetical protein